eukprot:GHVP01066368.1.p1 GENE.GHVP01066368.1~~GHVP01066368.1.p1  ORF type:complete len:819 (-),score=155.31 GHVP01066368.1:3284-5740(-)
MVSEKFQSSLKTSALKIPKISDVIHARSCCVGLSSIEDEEGIYLNMKTFESFGPEFLPTDSNKSNNFFYLNIRQRKIFADQSSPAWIEAQQVSKVAIGKPGGFKDSDMFSTLNFYDIIFLSNPLMTPCQVERIPVGNEENLDFKDVPEDLKKIVLSTLSHPSFTSSSTEIEAWEEDIELADEYENLPIDLSKGNPPVSCDPNDWKCLECGSTTNLWVNLSDRFVGCGRKNYGAGGGCLNGSEGAAVRNAQERPEFSLAMKLGTLTASGKADVFSYKKGDMVYDPLLSKHLQRIGIDIETMAQAGKTEKTIAEMTLDINKNWEWSKVVEDGESLESVLGPRCIGMRNIGNFCYQSSILQALLSVTDFRSNLLDYYKAKVSTKSFPSRPTKDGLFQLSRLFHALYSNEIFERKKTERIFYQNDMDKNGILPETQESIFLPDVSGRQFKLAFCKNQFAQCGMEDAGEFLQFLLEEVKKHELPLLQEFIKTSVSEIFDFQILEEKIKPGKDPIHSLNTNCILSLIIPDSSEKSDLKLTLTDLLTMWSKGYDTEETENVDKQNYSLYSLPETFCIQIHRCIFDKEKKEPRKLRTEVDIPDEIDLSFLLSPDVELKLQRDDKVSDAPILTAAQLQVQETLVDMGFELNAATHALLAGNASSDSCIDWILSNSENAEIFLPPPGKRIKKDNESDFSEEVSTLQAMGFDQELVIRALAATKGDLESAVGLLSDPDQESSLICQPDHAELPTRADGWGRTGSLKYKISSFVSHIGSSINTGHYVCHTKETTRNLSGGGYLICNDEKIARSARPPLSVGYIYFLQRVK